MKKRWLHIPLILTSVGLGFLAAPMPVRAQDEYRGSFSTRQHGYEHGYRDGYEYGRDARGRNVALDYRTDVYQAGDRGYRSYMGTLSEYREGYRDGYRIGAEEGYGGVRTGLERIFGDRDDPAASVYRERHWDYQDVAADVGYRDGVNAGLQDYREHHSYRPQEHDQWKDADHSYDRAFGNKADYKQAYRIAYENGYRAGYSGR
jgi:hypothetical protein